MHYYDTMKEDTVVRLDDVKKMVGKSLEEISKKSIPTSCFDESPYRLDINELDERYLEVFNYVKDNPGTTKQKIVDAFKSRNETSYSRHPIFNILNLLIEHNLIKVKKIHSQRYQLFVNDADIRVLLLKALGDFKNMYFELLHKTKPFIEKESGITPVTLVECLIMIYKFTKDKFFEFFVFLGNLNDKETLHRKFEIHNRIFREILEELYNNLVDANFINYDEEMEIFVNYSRSDVLGLENLSFIINSFEKHGLRKYVEPIIDWLWILFHKKLPLLYFEYCHLGEDGLKSWRALVNEEIKNLPRKRKLLYCPPPN